MYFEEEADDLLIPAGPSKLVLGQHASMDGPNGGDDDGKFQKF